MIGKEEIEAMADRIAKKLLKTGDFGDSEAYRVQFMLGKYGCESAAGGLDQSGLSRELARILAEELSQK
jgi:hypothetical protein